MARIFMDGFELGTLNLWTGKVGAPALSTSNVASGVYRLSLGAGAALYQSISPTSILYCALSGYMAADASPGQIFRWMDGSTLIGQLSFSTATRSLRYTRGSTVISTGAATLSSATYYRIEAFLQLSSDAGVGRFVAKVNGTTDIDYTGITQPSAATQFNVVYVGSTASYNPLAGCDDVVFDDATWVGNTKILALTATAAGGSTGWTPSAGNNWDCINEIPMATADYVATNTASALDLYSMTSLASSATSIKCIQVSVNHEIEGAPTPTKTQIVVRHNSTDAASSSLTPGAAGSPIYGTKLLEVNPVSGSSWTRSDVNSLQIGIKSATA